MPVQIDPLPPTAADDDVLRSRIADVVNAAFAVGEADMWQPGVARTTSGEIGDLVRSGQLLAAERDGQLVGCVRVDRLSGTTWGFGMLAVDPDVQSGGVGGALVDAAEQRAAASGAREMQLELLVPRDRTQDSKTRLKSWYAKRGYEHAGEADLETHHPDLLPLLAGPCTFEVWTKPLRD